MELFVPRKVSYKMTVNKQEATVDEVLRYLLRQFKRQHWNNPIMTEH